MKNWRDLAACITDDPEMFFPQPVDKDGREQDAKAVCRRCEVIDPCLTEAMSNPLIQGVWGGLSHAERSRLTRSIRRKRSPNRL